MASAVLVLVTVLTAGGLMEGRRWARPLEATRLVAVAATLAWCIQALSSTAA